MRQALKIYGSHLPNWLYLALVCGGWTYILRSGLLKDYWFAGLTLLILIPFIEFFVHKYILHMPRPKDPNKHKIWLFISDEIHYLHHQSPKHVKHIFAHGWMTFPPLVVIFMLLWFLSQNIHLTLVFMCSLLTYFLYYEWCHFISHFDGYTPRTSYGKFMKKFHLWHHYKNETYWLGITNPIADYLFGTWKDPKTIPNSELALTNRGRI